MSVLADVAYHTCGGQQRNRVLWGQWTTQMERFEERSVI
jgi:hypothetical protein